MSVRLFVGNLSYEVSESELRTLFSEAGAVTMVRVPLDRESGRPRGFAFVEFVERAEGEAAIKRFDQQIVKGRALAVSVAVPRDSAPRGRGRPPMRGPSADPVVRAAAPPADRPRRTFGPDAAPAHKRRREPTRGRGNKVPRPTRNTGRYRFAGDLEEEESGDELPFWAKHDDESGDEA